MDKKGYQARGALTLLIFSVLSQKAPSVVLISQIKMNQGGLTIP
jgi:hypothetical protein